MAIETNSLQDESIKNESDEHSSDASNAARKKNSDEPEETGASKKNKANH